MKRTVQNQPLDLSRALVEAFLTNDQVNQMLIDLIDPKIWRMKPPCSKRRSIATSFAHIHNVRVMRIGMTGSGRRPARLTDSAKAMARLIHESAAGGGHVKGFPPGIATLVCSAINHEAHHRGQICHWARELGAPITASEQLELWDWNKQWKAAVA